MANVEKDALTGTDTTGHEWDGIKELNTPLPKWWIYTFYVTIIWAIGYCVVYPSWPTLSGYWQGTAGYSSRAALAAELDAVKAGRSGWIERFEAASVADVKADQELTNYAMAGGQFIFNENCSACHGAGGQGGKGYPSLADDSWIWGGTVEDIAQTITYGVRSGHADARFNEMPSFGADGLLTAGQIDQVADYVLSLSGNGAANAEGKAIFEEQCVACHGEGGTGQQALGGPTLSDNIWLFGGSKDAIVAQVSKPKHGVMPAWTGRLSDVEIKQVAVYVHTLGGGQ